MEETEKQEEQEETKETGNECPVCHQPYQWDSFLQNFTCGCDVIIM
jgi:hypothetical protein